MPGEQTQQLSITATILQQCYGCAPAMGGKEGQQQSQISDWTGDRYRWLRIDWFLVHSENCDACGGGKEEEACDLLLHNKWFQIKEAILVINLDNKSLRTLLMTVVIFLPPQQAIAVIYVVLMETCFVFGAVPIKC